MVAGLVNITVRPGGKMVVVMNMGQASDWRLANILLGISFNVGCGCSPVEIRIDAVADVKGDS